MDIRGKMMTAHAALLQPSADEFTDRARGWARRMEDEVAERSGATLREARAAVARELGVSPGTLENLRNGRLKTLAVHIYDRLQRAMLRRLEAQLRRTDHEIQILRTQGVDPRENEMAAALADRAALREALGLEPE